MLLVRYALSTALALIQWDNSLILLLRQLCTQLHLDGWHDILVKQLKGLKSLAGHLRKTFSDG